MAKILNGLETAEAIDKRTLASSSELDELGVTPTLAIVRVGEKEADLVYERGITKRAQKVGVAVEIHTLSEDCTEEKLGFVISRLNKNAGIDGILLFRPLPKNFDEEKIINMIDPQKDVDGISAISAAGVYAGREIGYPPCTADAVMQILDYYNIPLAGKKAAVIGRSLVAGKPSAMMLLSENATVTICHTKTENLPAITKNADIIVCAAGHPHTFTADMAAEGQTVIDVGINVAEDGTMLGDADFDEVEKIVDAITPVPKGVGAVTVSVLLSHVAQAARKNL